MGITPLKMVMLVLYSHIWMDYGGKYQLILSSSLFSSGNAVCRFNFLNWYTHGTKWQYHDNNLVNTFSIIFPRSWVRVSFMACGGRYGHLNVWTCQKILSQHLQNRRQRMVEVSLIFGQKHITNQLKVPNDSLLNYLRVITSSNRLFQDHCT